MIKSTHRAHRKALAATDDTRTRILDAAERLFAERGIESVSVRAILAEAGVNVALAHYHFGSREGLIEELLRTRVAPLVQELLRDLDEVDARGAGASLEDVLRAYFAPTARWLAEQPRFGRIFAQLQASPSPAIRAMGRDPLRKVITRLGEAVMKRLPADVDPRRLFLRFYLVVGAWSYLSGSWEYIRHSARRHLGPEVVLEPGWVTEELVAFCAAGLRAGVAAHERKRT
jgi:AcrR family transcriptional regulator